MQSYTLAPLPPSTPLPLDPQSSDWQACRPGRIGHVRPESADFIPRVTFRLGYTPSHLHGLCQLQDRYVVCRHAQLNDPVCQDNCVECFLQPGPDTGYLNFEFNGGGILHASHIRDCTRTPTGFADYRLLTPQEAATIEIQSTLTASLCGPTSLPAPGTTWRANLYHCADDSSHPRWLSWSPIPQLNFHHPPSFAPLHFGT